MLAGAANAGLSGSLLQLESFPPAAQWGQQEEERYTEVRPSHGQRLGFGVRGEERGSFAVSPCGSC